MDLPFVWVNPWPTIEKLLKLMNDKNEPFNFSEIHELIGKEVSELTLRQGIAWHIAKRQIVENTFGIEKVYCINNKLSNFNSDEVMKREFLINLRANL